MLPRWLDVLVATLTSRTPALSHHITSGRAQEAAARLGESCWQPAADRKGRVAIGHQGGDERLPVYVVHLEDLQAADR